MNSLTLQNDDLYNDLASPGRWRVQIIFGSYPHVLSRFPSAPPQAQGL